MITFIARPHKAVANDLISQLQEARKLQSYKEHTAKNTACLSFIQGNCWHNTSVSCGQKTKNENIFEGGSVDPKITNFSTRSAVIGKLQRDYINHPQKSCVPPIPM